MSMPSDYSRSLDESAKKTWKVKEERAATMNRLSTSTGTGIEISPPKAPTSVLTASASGGEPEMLSSDESDDDNILSQHYLNNLKGHGLKDRVKDVWAPKESGPQKQQNNDEKLKQDRHTLQQNLRKDDDDDDDEKVVKVKDRWSFYDGVSFEKGSGKPMIKQSSNPKIGKVAEKAANDTLTAGTPPTPTRNQRPTQVCDPVVTPPCNSASSGRSDSGGDDEGDGDNSKEDEEEVFFGGDEEGSNEDNNTSSNANLSNNLLDEDFQSKLKTVEEKETNFQRKLGQQTTKFQRKLREQSAELVRLRSKVEELSEELEIQKQQNDELKQECQKLNQDLGNDKDDGDASVVEITSQPEISKSKEQREKEKKLLLDNLNLNSCVEARPSQLHGIGIHATRGIPKGTPVFTYCCKPTHKSVDLTPEEVDTLVPKAQEMVKKFFLQKEDGSYPVPKHGMACALGLSFFCNSSYSTGGQANVRFGDKKDLSGYLEIVADRDILPDEELLLSYKFPRLPDNVSSSLVAPSHSRNSGSCSDRQPSQQSREHHRSRRSPDFVSSSSSLIALSYSGNSRSSDQQPCLLEPPNRLRKRTQKIDYRDNLRRSKNRRKRNCGRFSNQFARFWMQPDNVWAPGKIHNYISAEERNEKCKCRQAVCHCPKYTQGMYRYTVEGYISDGDDEYFSDNDETVEINGLRGRDLWNSSV